MLRKEVTENEKEIKTREGGDTALPAILAKFQLCLGAHGLLPRGIWVPAYDLVRIVFIQLPVILTFSTTTFPA